MITFVISKQELFDLVNQETVYMSDPIGSAQDNTVKRLADVLPMTENERDYFNTKLFEVGVRILEKIAPYTKDIDTPYAITDETDATYPDSVVYKFTLPDGANGTVIIPLIQQYIVEALVRYIVTEWLKIKGVNTEHKETEFNRSLSNIKTAFTYGRKAVKTFRTL